MRIRAQRIVNLNPTSNPMDPTSRPPNKEKPETIQCTMWRRMISKYTEKKQSRTSVLPALTNPVPVPLSPLSQPPGNSQPESTSKKFAESHDHIPPKRPASGSDGAAPAKKPKCPPIFSSRDSPAAPSIATSVLNLTDGEMAAQYIQSFCPSPDRVILETSGDTELIHSYCLDHSKAMAKLAVIVSRPSRGFANPELMNELSSLKEDNAKLRSEDEKSQTLICRLTDAADTFRMRAKSHEEEIKSLRAEMDELRADCTKRIDEARAEGVRAGHRGFPESKDGLALIQSAREITKRAFLGSEEFWNVFMEGAKFYYSYALDEAEKWASSKGFTEKFVRDGPLENPSDLPCLEEDSHVNSLEPEAFAAHILLQVNREQGL